MRWFVDLRLNRATMPTISLFMQTMLMLGAQPSYWGGWSHRMRHRSSPSPLRLKRRPLQKEQRLRRISGHRF
jgi:hypothetical protein